MIQFRDSEGSHLLMAFGSTMAHVPMAKPKMAAVGTETSLVRKLPFALLVLPLKTVIIPTNVRSAPNAIHAVRSGNTSGTSKRN